MHSSELVVVLGTGPGLGQAIAKGFTDRGDHVILMARNKARLEWMAAELGPATGIPVDLTDEAALRSAFEAVRTSLGDPTVMVHNPSVAYEAPPTETPLSALMTGFALAAGSLLVAAQEVAPAMRRAGHGTILVTGNAAATTGSTWSASLAAQKAAARNLTLSLAAELGLHGIQVWTITIDGILGTPGFEHERIAAEYVRLASRTGAIPASGELTWPPQSP